MCLDTAIFQINKSNQLPFRKENEATVHSAAWDVKVQHTEALGQNFDLEKLTGPLLIIEGHIRRMANRWHILLHLTSKAPNYRIFSPAVSDIGLHHMG
jgi:hypothetical protein